MMNHCSNTPISATPDGALVRGLRNRHDGWTPERQRLFLEALSTCGCVRDAAAVVGMSAQSAYTLRRRPEAAGFAAAWDGALMLGRDLLVDAAMGRALNGVVEQVYCGGEIVERIRHDNRLLSGMIARLDRRLGDAAPERAAIASGRAAAGAFDALLDAIERGDAPAIDAIIAPPDPDYEDATGADPMFEEFRGLLDEGDPDEEATMEELVEEAATLMGKPRASLMRENLAMWKRYNAMSPDEIDASDLDLEERARWTADQWARAYRRGMIDTAVLVADYEAAARAAVGLILESAAAAT